MPLSRLSLHQLNNLIGLSNCNTEMINSILRKSLNNDDFDLHSQKTKLVQILKSILNSESLLNPSTRNILVSIVNRNDIEVFKQQSVEFSDKSTEELYSQLTNINPYSNKLLANLLKLEVSNFSFTPKADSPSNIYLPLINNIYNPLKFYQSKIAHEISHLLDIPRARAMICMPTGTGKTRTSMELVMKFINKGENVIWLVDSVELMRQALECFQQVANHIAKKAINISLIGFGNNGEITNENPNFIISGLQTLNNNIKKGTFITKNIGLVVFDEAHKATAPTYSEVVKFLLNIQNETRLIGLSATPFRASDVESKELRKFFSEKLFYIEQIDAKKGLIESLIYQGIMAKPLWHPLNYEKKFVLTEQEIAYLKQNKELHKSTIEKLVKDFDRTYSIIELLTKLGIQKRKTLFFGLTKQQSYDIAIALKCLGVQSAHIDADTPTSQRAHLISEFKNGTISILCNYGVLTTGFDAPKIDSIVLGRVSSSKSLMNQMIGRGLRGPQLGGTELCDIFVPTDGIPYLIANVEDAEQLMNEWA